MKKKNMLSIPTLPLSMPIEDVSFDMLLHYDWESKSIAEKGGKGSGHHGHAGRPGLVGGSAPAGGGGGIIGESSRNYHLVTDEYGLTRHRSGELPETNRMKANRMLLDYAKERAKESGREHLPNDTRMLADSEIRKFTKIQIIEELAIEMGENDPILTDLYRMKISEFLQGWAGTASDSVQAQVLQEEFAELFGSRLNDWQKDQKVRTDAYREAVRSMMKNEDDETMAFLDRWENIKNAYEKKFTLRESLDGQSLRQLSGYYLSEWLNNDNLYSASLSNAIWEDFYNTQKRIYDFNRNIEPPVGISELEKIGWKKAIADLRVDINIPPKKLEGKFVSQKVENHIINYYAYAPWFSKAEYKKLIGIIYDKTQEAFKRAGFDSLDKIKLYRGIKTNNNSLKDFLSRLTPAGNEKKFFVDWKPNALESWTTNIGEARKFGGYILAATIPVANIISSCITGWGCLNEEEFIAGAVDKIACEVIL